MHPRNSNLLARAIASLALTPALAVAAETNPSTGLEEVVVTGSYLIREDMDMATGLGLTPQETPQSVSVMTAQRIQDQQLQTVTQVVQNAVGVSTDDIDDVRHTYYSRGFEVKNYQLDGVPLAWSLAGDSGETIADTIIYERVEFVRGATGLMTGAGEPSASINLVRKGAHSTDFTGYVDAGTGRWSNNQLSADVATGKIASSPLGAAITVYGPLISSTTFHSAAFCCANVHRCAVTSAMGNRLRRDISAICGVNTVNSGNRVGHWAIWAKQFNPSASITVGGKPRWPSS